MTETRAIGRKENKGMDGRDAAQVDYTQYRNQPDRRQSKERVQLTWALEPGQLRERWCP